VRYNNSSQVNTWTPLDKGKQVIPILWENYGGGYFTEVYG